jgi:ParB/RepB/Spo0J family partition protein
VKTAAKRKPAPVETFMPRAATVALDTLFVASENARADAKPQGVDELAANLAVYGLLQPLVAYKADNGYAIVDGSRRFHALRKLYETSQPVFPVPLRLIDQADAHAASLAANTQRLDLGVVEAAQAWSRMVLDGKEIAEIARVFGVTERFVGQRLKLAQLHEPILEALAKGEISLDVAQAYAGALLPRQERVWKKLGANGSASWQVKRELQDKTLLAGDRLARFVGEAAYVAAGGVVEAELFSRAEDSRWLDRDLAEKLAGEKLKREAGALEAEGFLFVEAAPELDTALYVDGNFGKPRKPTPDEKARLDAIKRAEKDWSKKLDANEAANDFDYDLEDEGSAALNALDAEGAAIERSLVTFSDDAKQKSGVVVTIGDDGALDVRRGVVTPRARKATAGGKGATTKGGNAASTSPAKRDSDQGPMTNLTHELTSRVASTIVGRHVGADVKTALVALTARLARDLFDHDVLGSEPFGEEVVAVRLTPRPVSRAALLSDARNEAERKRWVVALGGGGKKAAAALELTLHAWPQQDVLALLAFCVGESVSCVETNAKSTYDEHDARARLAVLGRLATALPEAHFVPDAAYLEGYAKPTLEACAAELGVEPLKGATKSALAAQIATAAKERAWAPPLLRALCGVVPAQTQKAPLPVPGERVAAKRTGEGAKEKAVQDTSKRKGGWPNGKPRKPGVSASARTAVAKKVRA